MINKYIYTIQIWMQRVHNKEWNCDDEQNCEYIREWTKEMRSEMNATCRCGRKYIIIIITLKWRHQILNINAFYIEYGHGRCLYISIQKLYYTHFFFAHYLFIIPHIYMIYMLVLWLILAKRNGMANMTAIIIITTVVVSAASNKGTINNMIIIYQV